MFTMDKEDLATKVVPIKKEEREIIMKEREEVEGIEEEKDKDRGHVRVSMRVCHTAVCARERKFVRCFTTFTALCALAVAFSSETGSSL